MVQLADERRLLAEERSQLTISQRLVVEKQQEESLKQSQGSAKYEGMLCIYLNICRCRCYEVPAVIFCSQFRFSTWRCGGLWMVDIHQGG